MKAAVQIFVSAGQKSSFHPLQVHAGQSIGSAFEFTPG